MSSISRPLNDMSESKNINRFTARTQAELYSFLASTKRPDSITRKINISIETPESYRMEVPVLNKIEYAKVKETSNAQFQEVRVNRKVVNKVRTMHALGNSYGEIRRHMRDWYGLNLSSAAINALTEG